MLPTNFPSRKLVCNYFTKWKNDGTIELVHESLRDNTRRKAGKNESPGIGIIDNQSVKTTRSGGVCRGIDGGKKTKGMKRHIIVDTMGLLLAVIVHAANEHDSKSAPMVMAKWKELSHCWKVIVGYVKTLNFKLKPVRQ
jgi:transposase